MQSGWIHPGAASRASKMAPAPTSTRYRGRPRRGSDAPPGRPGAVHRPHCAQRTPARPRRTTPVSGAPTTAGARCTSPGYSRATGGTRCATVPGRSAPGRNRPPAAQPRPATCPGNGSRRHDGPENLRSAVPCSSRRTTGRTASARPPRRCARRAARPSCGAARGPAVRLPRDPPAPPCAPRSDPGRGNAAARCR